MCSNGVECWSGVLEWSGVKFWSAKVSCFLIVSVPDHSYLFTLHIRALVVVPCGGLKKSPRTLI